MDCEYPFDRKTEKDSYLAFVEMPDSCFGCRSGLHRLFQGTEVFHCLPSDLCDFFQVDGIGSGLSWFEGDGDESYFFFIVYEISSKHDVRKVVVFRKPPDIFVYKVGAHQAEWGVGIRNFYMEDHAKQEAYGIFYKLSGFSVTTDFTVSDDGIEMVPFLPELFKFVRVGLPVGVCLEDVIGMVFNGIAVTVENGGTVTSVRLVQGDE